MNDFIELRRVMAIVLRRWWLIAVLAAAAALLGFAASKQQTPVYSATTTLVVGQFMQSTNVNRTDIQTSTEVAKTYADIVVRQPVLGEVVKSLGLKESWQDLKKRVRVKTIEGTQLIEINVEANSSVLAADIANKIANQLIAISPTTIENSKNDSSNTFIREQVTTLREKINSGETRVKEIDAEIAKTTSTVEKEGLKTEKTNLEALLATWQKNYIDLSGLIRQEGLSNNYLTVIETAQATKDPIRPRIGLNTGLSGGVGLVLALSIMFLIEFFNDTYRTTEELEKAKDLSVLGAVGQIGGKSLPEKTVSELKPFSPITESYNMIRSKIQFKLADHPSRSIVVTSPSSGEGKSLTAVNLGIVMAKAGYKTLIVDADLRKPTLHRYFEVVNVRGLANALGAEQEDVETCVQKTGIENLSVLTCGADIENPTERLGSERMHEILACLQNMADVVILDSPPALHVADASLLSSHADGVVLVIKAGKTKRSEIQQALEHFQNANANLLGCIFNQAAVNGAYTGYGGHARKWN